MPNPECQLSPEAMQVTLTDLARACKVGGCSIRGWDALRSVTAGGDAGVMDEIRAKAAPDCVINELPQPMPEVPPSPTEQ